MNYPNHIYRTFEIVEKDIYGERHYAILEKRSFLWNRHVKVYALNLCRGQESPVGTIWHPNKAILEDAIKEMHRSSEREFKRKVTR